MYPSWIAWSFVEMVWGINYYGAKEKFVLKNISVSNNESCWIEISCFFCFLLGEMSKKNNILRYKHSRNNCKITLQKCYSTLYFYICSTNRRLHFLTVTWIKQLYLILPVVWCTNMYWPTRPTWIWEVCTFDTSVQNPLSKGMVNAVWLDVEKFASG